MTDEQDTPDEHAAAAASGPRGGERLAQARHDKHISVLEVAKELHLDEVKVRALERNDFDVLGAPVFAKGHLRKYAQLVGVDPDDVFADYYAMTRSTPMPPLVVGRRRKAQEISPGPWIAIVIVLVAAGASYWWFAMREPGATSPPTSQQPFEQEQPEAEPVLQQPLHNAPEPSPAVESAVPADEDDAAVLATDLAGDATDVEQTRATLSSGEIRLTMNFSGDCWADVSDADGRRLLLRTGRAGDVIEVVGKAPLAALFGNVDNVSVLVNDQDFRLPSTSNANRTVRVSIPGR